MASDAALDEGVVLINKWSLLVGVALEADRVLRGRGPQLSRQESTVRVVAIRAFHQAFIYPVMERPVELLLLVQVAAVTEVGLFQLHQKLAFCGMVRVVAVRTSHAVLQVRRPLEVAVFFAVLVTIEAARADLFCRDALERKYLALVPAALDVRFSRAVAGFAAMPLGALLRIERGHEVR